METNQKMLIITEVSKINSEKERKDGKISRQYVTVKFSEALLNKKTGEYYPNAFRTGTRVIFQNHSADGKSANWKVSPSQLEMLKDSGNAIPGEIVTAKVEQFPVLGADGKQSRTKDGQLVFADQYSAVVLGGESTEKIFGAAGHKLTGKAAISVATELVA